MAKQHRQNTEYKLIMPGKSWTFINPAAGCPLDCAYCVEQKDDWFKKGVNEIYTPQDTLQEIENSNIVLPNKTPLTFYNFSDPFLTQNKENLLQVLQELDGRGWENKVGLISKLHPGQDYLSQISKLKNLKVGLFVSYANLTPGIEKASYQNRVELMKDAHELGIPVVDYVRPLVWEWTNEERIKELANQIKGHANAVSLSGIRLTPEIIEELTLRGVPVPEVKSFANKQRDDHLSRYATNTIRNITGVPVFWHTSCAMSYLFGEPDYNSHDIRQKRKRSFCNFPCEDTQRKICNSRECNSSDEEVSKVIQRLEKDVGFVREDDTLLLTGDEVTREDVSFVRHHLPEFVMKNNYVIFMGGSKGVGKTTLAKKLAEDLGFKYINTGDRFRKYRPNFERSFAQELIDSDENIIVDTHFAPSSSKTPKKFCMGLDEKYLMHLFFNMRAAAQVVLIGADTDTVFKRRLEDSKRKRCLDIEQIVSEGYNNSNNSRIYASTLQAPLIEFINQGHESIEEAVDELKKKLRWKS